MKKFFLQIHQILTLNCDDASRLASDSFERSLGFPERWALRMHVLGCRSCRQFKHQLKLLREAFKKLSSGKPEDGSGELAMSQEFKDRLRLQLRDHLGE